MQRMDRLRRSLRDSFRRKREAPESTKPHQWQADEEAVRQGICSFHVKYLGCVEVFESRGMNVCEEAMRVLRQSRRRPVKSVLFVSGDGLRVVEDDTKGLIVDQTIEKVSFCAPDRNHERGFSYICRDGTTRRWMCHGFLSTKDSGERLSHAVGCAFAACLERKQKREKECGVSMTFDPKTSTFTRSGSFRVSSITDSNSMKSSSSPPPLDSAGNAVVRSSSLANTSAIERPHAPVKMLERQGSFRGFSQLSNQSPFKRQLSLRLSDLPSNIQRAQNNVDILTNNVVIPSEPLVNSTSSATPPPPPRNSRTRLHSLPNNSLAGHGAIPAETAPLNMTGIIPPVIPKQNIQQPLENKDLVSELCQQVSQGLSLLAANHDDVKNSQFPTKFTNPWDDDDTLPPSTTTAPPLTQTRPALPFFNSINLTNNSSIPPVAPQSTTAATVLSSGIVSSSRIPDTKQDQWVSNLAQNQIQKPSLDKNPITSANGLVGLPPLSSSTAEKVSATTVPHHRPPAALPPSATATVNAEFSPPISATVTSKVNVSLATAAPTTTTTTSSTIAAPPTHPARPPLVSTQSVAGRPGSYRGPPAGGRSHSLGADPFSTEWAAGAAKQGSAPTNPFNSHSKQAFQIHL